MLIFCLCTPTGIELSYRLLLSLHSIIAVSVYLSLINSWICPCNFPIILTFLFNHWSKYQAHEIKRPNRNLQILFFFHKIWCLFWSAFCIEQIFVWIEKKNAPKNVYHISSYSFRGNYSFLNLKSKGHNT